MNWPDGHVGVRITDLDDAECFEVTIHGVRHFLHATTVRELHSMLSGRLDEWNAHAKGLGFPGV